MTIYTQRVTVVDTPTMLSQSDDFGCGYQASISNHDEKNPVFIGDENVTVETGFELGAGKTITIPTGAGEELWAIVGGDKVVVSLITTSR